MSTEELRLALARGEANRQTLVWCEGMPQWQPLESVDELQGLLARLPPPLPTTPPPLPVPVERATPGRRKTAPGPRGRGLVWLGLGLLLAVGVTITIIILIRSEAAPPVVEATGQIRIDANPWGRVQWIRRPKGEELTLPDGRTTPFLMTLPIGTYQASVAYPHTQASQLCNLEVRQDELTLCWLDLAPVDAQGYFQEIGW